MIELVALFYLLAFSIQVLVLGIVIADEYKKNKRRARSREYGSKIRNAKGEPLVFSESTKKWAGRALTQKTKKGFLKFAELAHVDIMMDTYGGRLESDIFPELVHKNLGLNVRGQYQRIGSNHPRIVISTKDGARSMRLAQMKDTWLHEVNHWIDDMSKQHECYQPIGLLEELASKGHHGFLWDKRLDQLRAQFNLKPMSKWPFL